MDNQERRWLRQIADTNPELSETLEFALLEANARRAGSMDDYHEEIRIRHEIEAQAMEVMSPTDRANRLDKVHAAARTLIRALNDAHPFDRREVLSFGNYNRPVELIYERSKVKADLRRGILVPKPAEGKINRSPNRVPYSVVEIPRKGPRDH